jgi:methylglutaconyl-CoA hydratase
MTGIVEVSLERPQVRNAIGKDMLKGLQNTFDAISNDSSANVLLIRSKVPKVFCAGADLKVSNPIIFFLESMCVYLCIWVFKLMFF